MTALADRRVVFALALMAALALLPLVAQALDQGFYVGQLRRVLIIAIAAVGLDLVLGYGGMVSLGHAAFFGIGAYVVAILHWHGERELLLPGGIAPPTHGLAVVALAMLVAGALAAAIGAVSLRTSGIYFIMITLAFAQMLYFLFVSLRFDDGGRAYGGDDGLRFRGGTRLFGVVDTRDELAFTFAVWAILALLLWLGHRLTRARFGIALQAIRDNGRRMQALGLPTRRYQLAAFALSGAIAGLAGALYAYHEGFVSPSLMHWTRSGDLVVMVVLGGMGTLIGPVAGATLFLLLEKLLPDYTEHWMLVFGPVLVLLVLFAKGGLVALADRRGARDD